ncbi:sporulation integral membrane protein YlbJ [Domibacillus epiphyticus]|uniref:Sporulation integral membrane protein YlbJ n=1 Tax=Domibacillus epiphyticus TaxID=1714355 RepID=A0A1V2ABY5_9BACI|nr:sporulation integral membrane protein YlbJ [Domibacillus epiphyticus]OMP68506.1 sporulation integral membrane protein YlbJ [Domibacillus epiphyticus]
MNRVSWKTSFAAVTVTLLTASLLFFSSNGLNAARVGMDMWWKTVFPSLLPFFILTELLLGLGVVAFFGSLTEKVMRVLFRLPGPAGVAWILSLASGFPTGAKLAARLRADNTITQIEAERLLAFAHSSNPLFILGAIASGFLQDPDTGFLLAAAHYMAAFFVGITMRFYGGQTPVSPSVSTGAIESFFLARKEDGRAFGTLIADAVISSVQTLMLVGGFIVFFSVMTELLKINGIFSAVSFLFLKAGVDISMTAPLITGLIELTAGAKQASSMNGDSADILLIISFMLAFSGFSVHAQVASIISETDIRYGPFFFARILHSIYAVIITFLLIKKPTATVVSVSAIPPEKGMMMTVLCLAITSILLTFQYKNSRHKRN